MDDLSAMLGQILGSEEGMAQLRNAAAALGLGGQSTPPPGPQSAGQGAEGTPDLSGLAATLQNLLGKGNQTPAPEAPQQTPDLSGLASMLSGLMGSGGDTGGGNGAPAGTGLPNIDLNTILTLQKAYAAFTARDKNTELLQALRPHFSEERQKKVDDAIRILGLVKILPLLKESGILDGLGGILGGES